MHAENGYNLLREDGGRGMVLGMWKKSHTHEMMRLPMIYIAVWKIDGDGMEEPRRGSVIKITD